MPKAALVIGGTVEGVQAAIDLAESHIRVYLIESSLALRETNAVDSERLPRLVPKLLAAARHPNMEILTNAEVTIVEGSPGGFRVNIVQHPRYVLEEKCSGCSRCESACPVEIGPVHQVGRSKKAISSPSTRSIPLTYVVTKLGKSPCREACPGGVNGQGYLALISKGKFAEALDLIREAVPFPGVLGRVCTRPCESACTRGKIDEPLAICWLKRFVADYEMLPNNKQEESNIMSNCESKHSLDKNGAAVAIIGSGPAGLTAARDLALLGHKVTVFEALSEAGGMLRTCIPPFRLPRNVLDAEIAYVRSCGVDIKTSTPIGQACSIDDLKAQGYQAILIAIGAHKPRALDIPGDSLPGVVDCIDLLKNVHFGHCTKIEGRVVVIGGGNAAIDAARTAVRLGADEVRILYRRRRIDMPAHHAEVEEAEKEGVVIDELVAPTRVLGMSSVNGIECVRTVVDAIAADGRSNVGPVKGSEFAINADFVITAIGQYPDLDFLTPDYREQFGPGARASVDAESLASRIPSVFVAGDAVSGPSTVIEAIAAGQRAARSINAYLESDKSWQQFIDEKWHSGNGVSKTQLPPLDATLVDRKERVLMPSLDATERRLTFAEVELGFDAEAAIREAQRCLNCGGCSECMECVRSCELDAIAHDESPENLTINVGAIVVASSSHKISGDGIYHIDTSSPLSQASFISSSAAAAKALFTLSSRSDIQHNERTETVLETVLEPFSSAIQIDRSEQASNKKTGLFLCECGGQISSVIDFAMLSKSIAGLGYVSHIEVVPYVCSGSFNERVKEEIAQEGLRAAVIAACPCCSTEQICSACSHSRIRCKGRFATVAAEQCDFEFVNIREQCAWVHFDDPMKATENAVALVEAGIERLRGYDHRRGRFRAIHPSALVIGAGTAGIQSASDISNIGYSVTLLSQRTLSSSLREEILTKGVVVAEEFELTSISGTVGNFEVTGNREGEARTYSAGVIVIDGEAIVPAQDGLFKVFGRPFQLRMLSTNTNPDITPPETVIPGVYLCNPRLSSAEAENWGSAAAIKAAIMLGKRRIQLPIEVANVDTVRCRGCGDCEKICSYYAIRVTEREGSPGVAVVDEALCRGCGNCAAHCRTGAIKIYGASQTPGKDLLAALLRVWEAV